MTFSARKYLRLCWRLGGLTSLFSALFGIRIFFEIRKGHYQDITTIFVFSFIWIFFNLLNFYLVTRYCVTLFSNTRLWLSRCVRIQHSLLYVKWLPTVRKSQSLISKWNFDSNTAIPLWVKFIPKLWAEWADQKHVNNRRRLVSTPCANYYNGCQTSNVWRRNMSRSRESRPRGSREQQTKITYAARARTLNRLKQTDF